MKQLTLIVRTSAQQDLTDQLRTIEQVQGFTLSHVEGHGVQAENDPFLSARDKVVGYTPRVQVDIVLQDSDLDDVLKVLRDTMSDGEIQGAHYWVTAIEQEGHL